MTTERAIGIERPKAYEKLVSGASRVPIFDQFTRCNAVAEVVRSLSGRDESVIDVGSGSGMLFARVLDDRKVVSLDPLISPRDATPAAVSGVLNDEMLERFGEGAFDWVVAIDTLEHIPPGDRSGFLDRITRLAKLGVVIACPVDDYGESRRVDRLVDDVYQRKNQAAYPWLAEHAAYGLPLLADIRGALSQSGFQTAVRGNGHTPWLVELLPLTLVLLDHERGNELVDEISRLFIAELLPHDNLEPVYRQLIVGHRRLDPETRLPSRRDPSLGERAEIDAAWQRVRAAITARIGTFLGQVAAEVPAAQRELLCRMEQAFGSERPDFDKISSDLARLPVVVQSLSEANAKLTAWRRVGEQYELMRERLAIVTAANGDLAQHLEQMRLACDAHRDSYADVTQQLERLRTEHVALRDANVDAEEQAERLRAQYEALREENAGVVRTAESLRRERDGLQQSLAEAEAGRLEMRDRCEELAVQAGRLARVEAECLELSEKVARWRTLAIVRGESLSKQLRVSETLRADAVRRLHEAVANASKRKPGLRGRAASAARRVKRGFGDGLIAFGKSARRALPLPTRVEAFAERVFFSLTGWFVGHTAPFSNHRQAVARKPVPAVRVPAPTPSPASRPAEEAAASAVPGTVAVRGTEGKDSAGEAQWLPDVDTVPEAVVQFGVIDWHFRHQRPQHLAEALAGRGHRVFYVSPRLIDRPEPGYDAEEIEVFGADGEPVSGRVVQINLHVAGRPMIYKGDIPDRARAQLIDGLGQALRDFGVGRAIALVQHPGWWDAAVSVPNARLVYDCMDNHSGFAEAGEGLLSLEERLFRYADLTIVTSNWLESLARERTDRVVVIRNACHPDHFETPRGRIVRPRTGPGGRVIGYFGAIAEWFDVELVRKVAARYPGDTVWLIGADTAGVAKQLSDAPNVILEGEVPYAELSRYVHGMDVCLIPFRLTELILATNPVKVYEAMAAGKPVVSTDLPELHEPEFERLVYTAETHEAFVEAVGSALAEGQDRRIVAERRRLGREQTWAERSKALEVALGGVAKGAHDPLVSIVVVTWNNLDLTRACLESILADESYGNIEVIVVDNASTDDTPAYVRETAMNDARVRPVLLDENTGFAKGNNTGLEAASGDVLILLNNDTVVTHGWVRTMVNHLTRDESIGMLGVITNNIGNEARVDTTYTSLDDMPREAYLLSRANIGRVIELPVVAFFCCGMRRDVYEAVGPLDTNYGLGYFEDDDYCQRIRSAGFRVCCAEDVFVHHHLSASFGQLGNAKRDALLAENRRYYESKWGTWQPHRYRNEADQPLVRLADAGRTHRPAVRAVN